MTGETQKPTGEGFGGPYRSGALFSQALRSVRFLGVDLAWNPENASGVACLSGNRFPLYLRDVPRTLPNHQAVFEWVAGCVRRHRAVVAIDAPLWGTDVPGRRACDNDISRTFGRFHASTHTPPRTGHLWKVARALRETYGLQSFGPGFKPVAGRPAIREVYPNALQVRLFDLDRSRGAKILKYKRRKFRTKAEWVDEGLRPFIARCARLLGSGYVDPSTPGWVELAAAVPSCSMRTADLKSIEDRWDALLCALAVAFELLTPGVVCFYPASAWRNGAILAPVLRSSASTPSPSRS